MEPRANRPTDYSANRSTTPTTKPESFIGRIKSWPKTRRILLVAAVGLILAAVIAALAVTLSGGDSTTLNKSAQGSSNGNAATKTNGQSAANGATQNNDTSGQASGNGANQTAGEGGNTSSKTSPSSNPPASAVNTNPSPGSTISIANMAFSPATLTVAKNTTITWKNNDSTPHAIGKAADQPNGPHSPELQPGSTYSYSYATAGTYKYICVIHPQMTGTIIVKD